LEQGKKNKEQGSGAAQQGRPKSDSIDIALAKKFCAQKPPWHKKRSFALTAANDCFEPKVPMLQQAHFDVNGGNLTFAAYQNFQSVS